MSPTLLDQPLGSLACEIPGATRVFHAFNLDFCCGGHKSLREAAALRGIEPDVVAAELDSLQARGGTQLDWRTEPSTRLIEHILKRYHARHREQLPELIRLACRVEQVHGDRADCPNGLADLLRDMQQELESHMLKEEQILFPMLLSGYAKQASAPISVMRFEHDHHGLALEQMEALTHGLTPPQDACNTWCALYRGLNELHDDLMQHIHLENNVLFVADQA
ncbi:iron-sulfur cluster repair protein YtfE [Pseudomonas sp. MMS21-TM103]|uniref:iron-sulfur cluster repair protein YtfE n=1 Tax=unclassified Pseudomonas TaxID=196821 RepID=UPI001EDF9ECB|nr:MULTISPECIES: iron-sulfur cluster repair protein YtfE [unclassified Pseudomonas]MCG4453089.1 iron-sulfur cluster repair protein YtfE [Pseudomonas sp. MMS21 TM103]